MHSRRSCDLLRLFGLRRRKDERRKHRGRVQLHGLLRGYLLGLGRRILLSVLSVHLRWLLQVGRLHDNFQHGLLNLPHGLHEHGRRHVHRRL
jgi:hypothetical protein